MSLTVHLTRLADKCVITCVSFPLETTTVGYGTTGENQRKTAEAWKGMSVDLERPTNAPKDATFLDLEVSALFAEAEESWQDRALCAQTDPEAFFPEKGGSTREAKRICTGCEVKPECLEYALANDERFGIWGGLSERERRRLKKASGQ